MSNAETKPVTITVTREELARAIFDGLNAFDCGSMTRARAIADAVLAALPHPEG